MAGEVAGGDGLGIADGGELAAGDHFLAAEFVGGGPGFGRGCDACLDADPGEVEWFGAGGGIEAEAGTVWEWRQAQGVFVPEAIGDDLEEPGVGLGELLAEIELGHRVAGGAHAEGDGDGLAGGVIAGRADEERVGSLGHEADTIRSGAHQGQGWVGGPWAEALGKIVEGWVGGLG